jgi:regulator of protease activity HflC (stomatin/prohibitin superfamily)
MGQLLQLILDNLFKLWPVRMIRAHEQGVRLGRKGDAKLLLPGWHLFMPGVHQIERMVTAYQMVDCDLQSCTTRDGKEITVSLNLGYRITDLALMWVNHQHFDTTLINKARGHALEVIMATDFDVLTAEPAKIARVILAAAREDVRGTGVKLVDAQLDQFVKAKQYRFLGGSHAPSGFGG